MEMSRRICALILTLALVLSLGAGASAGNEVEATEPNGQVGQTEPVEEDVIPVMLRYRDGEDDESVLYNRIVDCLANLERRIEADDMKISAERAAEIFETVLRENPQLDYIRKYKVYSEKGYATSISVEINQSAVTDEILLGKNRAILEALSRIEKGMSEAEIALVLHDYLVDTVAYSRETATVGEGDEGRIYRDYGALVYGEAVCSGYTKAYQLLLSAAGIESKYVRSRAMNHAWTLVKIDGEWYHVDVTWDDPTPNTEGGGRYDYFLLSDATISDREHRHYGWDAEGITCTSRKYESGYGFNDSEALMHYFDGEYYYFKEDGLYRGGFEGNGELVASAKLAPRGVLRMEDEVYYMVYDEYDFDADRWMLKVMRCDLESGECTEVGEPFAFEQEASQDGRFGAAYDVYGMALDETGTALEIVSPTRREAIAAFDLPKRQATEKTEASGEREECDNVAKPAGFTDVTNPNEWFYAPVYAAANAGIIAGNTDGTFAPYDELNRAQAVAFAVRLAQYNAHEEIYGADDQRGEWYEIYIDYARENGIVSEDDSPTPWESEIDRAAAATIFAAVLGGAEQINDIPAGYFADVPVDDPAHDAIYALARAGICNGKGVNAEGEPIFGTNDTFLRSEVAAIVARMAGIVETVRIET